MWQKLLEWFFAAIAAKPAPAEPAKPVPGHDLLDWFVKRDQWGEHSPENVRELSRGWALTKYCKSYKTIIGAAHAWCGMGLAMACKELGYAFPEQCESAYKWIGHWKAWDWKKLGSPKGALVVVKGDSYHVALCDEDTPAGFKSAPLRGANQDNRIKRKMDSRTVVWVGIPEKT
jgi:hypothetical protein